MDLRLPGRPSGAPGRMTAAAGTDPLGRRLAPGAMVSYYHESDH
jgi:hypothetical protein